MQNARFGWLNIEKPLVITVKVYDGIVQSIDDLHTLRVADKLHVSELATASVERWFMKKGTKRIDLTVAEHGIHGSLFIPPGEGPFPGI